MKRGSLLIAGALLLALVVTSCGDSGPVAGGKSARKWSKELSSSATRSAAVEGLKAAGDQGGTVLVWIIQQPDEAARAEALKALPELGKEAVPALLTLLESSQFGHASLAAKALATMGPDAAEAAPALVKALVHQDREFAHQAESALKEIGPAVSKDVLTIFDNQTFRGGGVIILSFYGPEVLPAFYPILNGNRAEPRWLTLQTLGNMGPEGRPLRHVVEPMMADPDPTVRSNVVYAMVAFGLEPQSLEPILEMAVKDSDSNVRSQAYSMMVSRSDIFTRHPDWVLNGLRDGDPRILTASLNMTGRLGAAGKPAIPILLNALNTPMFRSDAASAIRTLGPEGVEALPTLFMLVDSAEPAFQMALLKTIGAADTVEAMNFLKTYLQSSEPGRRLGALMGIRLAPTAGMALLPEVESALADQEESVREEAARTYFILKGEAGVPFVMEKLAGQEAVLRRAASELKHPEKWPELAPRTPDAGKPSLADSTSRLKSAEMNERIKGLRDLAILKSESAPAIQDVILQFKDPDWRVRRAAMAAAREIGSDAVSPLRAALESPDPNTRRCAALALGSILPEPQDLGATLAKLASDPDPGTQWCVNIVPAEK